jgi:ATP-binding cassette, subfamily B, bacterial
VFSEFSRYTRGDRLRLLGGGVLSLVLVGAELGTVVIFEAIVGRVLERHHLAGFWVLAGTWLAIAAVGALAMAGSRRLDGLAAGRVQLRLRDAVFSRAQRLPADYFDEQRLGDLLVRLTDDVAVVEGAIASGPVTLVTSAASIAVFAAAALVIRWDLALVAFAAASAFWLLARGFSGPARRAADAERAASGSLASAVEESLANQMLIQAFNRQDAESRRLHREGLSWLRAVMAETKLDSAYEPLVYFLETCCVLLVFAVGAWDVAGGRLSLAGLLALAACLAYLYPPVQSLSGLVLSLSEASASAARLSDILGARAAVAEEGPALRGKLLGRGRIDVEDVTFSYPGGAGPVLDRLCFTAAPGRLLAVTGPSGAGKSTVARLLLRFRDPDAGRILLDGIDVRELSLRTLRYNVTLLTQEALLFPGTVADNIRYGRTGATDDEVAAAARAADAHAFITALPSGYDTPAGQRGRLLSGGQRQRICLARAFLRNAPVLVLDEPTTGLDTDSAERLLAVIRRFAASHTVILITHDPRVVATADDVLYLAPPATLASVAAPAPPAHYRAVSTAMASGFLNAAPAPAARSSPSLPPRRWADVPER